MNEFKIGENIALGVALVGLELGFLWAYRAGWQMNLAALVSNLWVTLLLIPIGFIVFRETLSWQNILGVTLAIVGLVLIGKR